jgi:hypothetical protein
MKIRVALIWITLLGLLPLGSWGQGLAINARLDSTHLLLGSAMGLELEFRYPESAEALWPLWKDPLGKFEVIREGEIQESQEAGLAVRRQRLQLTCFDSGYFQVPPIEFVALSTTGDTLRTETSPLGVEVYTVAVDTTQAFKPIRDPIEAPVVFREVLPYLVLALLAIGIGLGIWWYRRKKALQPVEEEVRKKPRVLPQLIAKKRLQALQSQQLWQQGEFKAYYSELTNIIREYLGNRYDILALESTTDEIITDLRDKKVSGEQKIRLEQLLQQADLTKFAKFRPTAEDCQTDFQAVEAFIKATALPTLEALDEERGYGSGEGVKV